MLMRDAGFFGPGSIPLGSWPLASLAFPNSRKLPFVEFGASIFLLDFSLLSSGIGDSFDNVRKKLSWPHLYNFAKKVELLASNLCS